jgi:cytosine/uracil/thiamine/allantoin permease
MSQHIVPDPPSPRIIGYSFSTALKKMPFATITAKLQVKPTDDEYEAIETTRWGNRDIYPVAHDKRVYSVYDFIAYWVSSVAIWTTTFKGETFTDTPQGTCGMCLSSWTIGSSLIGIGLTAGQAMGAVVSYFFLSFDGHVLTLTV